MISVSETEAAKGGKGLSSYWIGFPKQFSRKLHLKQGPVLGIALYGQPNLMVGTDLPMAGTQEGGSSHQTSDSHPYAARYGL